MDGGMVCVVDEPVTRLLGEGSACDAGGTQQSTVVWLFVTV